MKRSQTQVLFERIRHYESQLDNACFQKEKLAKQLEACGVRKRGHIEREMAALQTQIDYLFRQYSDAESEKFALESQRVRLR
jgi:hypothetical protein